MIAGKYYKKKKESTFLEISAGTIPVNIYYEYRKNIRFSIGKNAAILRLPLRLSKKEIEVHKQTFQNWVKEKFEKETGLAKRFFGKLYKNGDSLKVGSKTYTINISQTNNKHYRGKLIDKTIFLQYPDEKADPKVFRKLISRLVAQDFKPQIEKRVYELNEQHFKQAIKGIHLKYNQSNWGSCSSQRNINLSTRLLFAPQTVIDYVIIHELAHLVEMNHSQHFWHLVQKAMPDYKEKEAWLKQFNNECQF